MTTGYFVSACILFAASTFSSSQASSWGTGAWGAMQACPYEFATDPGFIDAGLRALDIEARLTPLMAALSRKEDLLKKLEERAEKDRETVESATGHELAEKVFDHIDQRRVCGDDIGDTSACPKDVCPEKWDAYCRGARAGAVNSVRVCRKTESGGGDRDRRECVAALNHYTKAGAEREKLRAGIDRLQAEIDERRESIQQDQRVEEDMREWRLAITEGGICWDCAFPTDRTLGANQIRFTSNVAVGLMNASLGNQMNQSVAASVSPHLPYAARGYGWPYLNHGLYGAIAGGIGAGSFGCGSGPSAVVPLGGLLPPGGNLIQLGVSPPMANPPWGSDDFSMRPFSGSFWPAAGFNATYGQPGMSASPSGSWFGEVPFGMGPSVLGARQPSFSNMLQQNRMFPQSQVGTMEGGMQREGITLQLQSEISSLMLRLQQLQVPTGGSFYLGGGDPAAIGPGGALAPQGNEIGVTTPFPGPGR